MTNEALGVLVLRAVIGVRVNDQLRIWDVLLHDERIHCGHDHVVTAVHDECWLLDRLQIVVGSLLLDPHLSIAAICAGETSSLTSGSRPS